MKLVLAGEGEYLIVETLGHLLKGATTQEGSIAADIISYFGHSEDSMMDGF